MLQFALKHADGRVVKPTRLLINCLVVFALTALFGGNKARDLIVLDCGKGQKMNGWFTLAIFALIGCTGCETIKPSPGGRITEQQDQQLCGLLIASHRSSLESMFEIELYAVAYDTDDWHVALKSLNVPTSDSSTRATGVRFFHQQSLGWYKWKMPPTACVWSICYLEVGCLWTSDGGLMSICRKRP